MGFLFLVKLSPAVYGKNMQLIFNDSINIYDV